MSDDRTLRYSSTLLYGKYTSDLGDFARTLKISEQGQQDGDPPSVQHLKFQTLQKFWYKILTTLGDQWMLMIILGLTIAVLSFVMDYLVTLLHNSRLQLFNSSPKVLAYLSWISLPVLLVTFASVVVQLISPHAIGSGFAEIRCILRGTTLHGYLDFRTLAAKVVGLVAVLGAGMPLGKEGPFVHIACILSQLYTASCCMNKSSVECRSRSLDLLAGAAAVGVGACFASPVGGMLLSIEATAPCFAIRNYWRGFLGAASGTLLYQLLIVWSSDRKTIEAIYETDFLDDVPYRPLELILFGLVGLFCGLLGALFVYILRIYIQKVKSCTIRECLLKTPLLYPVFVSLIIATLQYPPHMSRFTAGNLDNDEHFEHLFSNFSWTKRDLTVQEATMVHQWKAPIESLAIFFVYLYFSSILASTLPVPSGMFIPLFKIGAVIGRLSGEVIHILFNQKHAIASYPGGYAVVGAAAFSGAVTHTVSTCVIILELTGQLRYVLPIIVAAMISNIVARKLHPSLYDMLTSVKGLQPPATPKTDSPSGTKVKDLMESPVECVWRGIELRDLIRALEANLHREVLPVVDDPETRRLLGSVQCLEVERLSDENQVNGRLPPIESIRIQLLEDDLISDAYQLLQLTKVNFAFVTNQSRLVGFVGKNKLKNALEESQENIAQKTIPESFSEDKFEEQLLEQGNSPHKDYLQMDDRLETENYRENVQNLFEHQAEDHKEAYKTNHTSNVLYDIFEV
ncbi:chloride channel protein 2-like isoform X1 [Aedes albopictus]|uniref:CBS domain-containing protein n=1 Tax=Aedes albopictus TaxID=7160 RepID=A0ABM1YP98_AEDAL